MSEMNVTTALQVIDALRGSHCPWTLADAQFMHPDGFYAICDSDGVQSLPANLTNAIDALVQPLGWTVTHELKGEHKVFIERLVPARATVGPHLFHVTEARNLHSIQSKGILCGTGGNTSFNRHYPSRVYFAKTLTGAVQFVLRQRRGLKALAPLEEYAIIRVLVDNALGYFVDPMFPSEAVWRNSPVDRSLVSSAGETRALVASVCSLNEQGFVSLPITLLPPPSSSF